MYVRSRTGGTAGAGLAVSTNDTSTFTLDGGGSSTTRIKWYVQIYGATGNWSPVNTAQNVNSPREFLAADMTSSQTSMILTNASRIEPGNNCLIGLSFNPFGASNESATPQECVTVGTPSGTTVPITARGVSCGGATAVANAHYSGDYSPNPNSETSTGTGIACNLTGRPGAWIATYVSGTQFSVPLNSSSFGTLTGTVHIERSGPITSPTSTAITYPMFGEHGNFSGYTIATSGGYLNATWPTSVGVGGCTDSSTQGLINCKIGYTPPTLAYTGAQFPQISIASVSVASGIGTVTLSGPYTESTGNAYQCGTSGNPACVGGCGGSTLCSNNVWLNRLFWLSGMAQQNMNTYFLVCDNTNLSACSSGAVTRHISGLVTSWNFLCQLRDGTTCADGSYTLNSGALVDLPPPQIVRIGMDYQAPSVPNAWGSDQGNNTKDSIPATTFNHIRYNLNSGGSEQRRLDGAYTTGSFGTYSQTGWETVWNSNSQLMPMNGVFAGGGANNLHYYYEPSCSRYAGQWNITDINPTPHTQVNGSGGEQWPYDPIFNGHAWSTYQPYAPNGLEGAHALYNMYAWYLDNGGQRENYNGTLTQGTTQLGPIKFYSVTGEPEEMVHSKVATWAPVRYGSGNQGYEVCWGGPKEIDASRWTYNIAYSTSDLKTIGFSNGTSGGSVAPNNNSTSEYQDWQSSTMALNAVEYIGIRPVAAIEGCSGSGISPIWCELQTYQGPGIDPMYASGDHVTVSGVGGNTAANQTAAAIPAVQPRVIWWLNDPRWAYQSISGYSLFGTDSVEVNIPNCCAARAPWAYQTGDIVAFTGTGTGNIDSMTGYPITDVDANHFVLTGPSWAATCGNAGCTAGARTRKLVAPATNALTSAGITATGGGGSGESCQANLSNDPTGMYPGEFLTVAFGGTAGLGSSGPINYAITAAAHTNPYSLTFSCPNVPDGTYNTEQSLTTSRFALVTWPAFALPGTGSAAYTSGGTVVATDDTKNFSEITFAPPVSGTLGILTTALPNATAGSSYSQSLLAVGGTPPYTWAANPTIPPPPPAGLTLSGSTDVISGIPTTPGSTNLNITVTDSALPPPATATTTLPITIITTGTTITGSVTCSGCRIH